jgi:NACHT domain/Leucine Rich repeats (2 copies)
MEEAGRFEIEYRQAVARNLDVLHLIGADVSLPNRRHRLSVAYITLSVEQKLFIWLENGDEEPAMMAQSSEIPYNEMVGDIVSVDAALAHSHRLLIRGDAGSGKTTFLQWIAVKAATRSFDKQLASWNNKLPFYIRLRQCIQSGLPRPEDFPRLVAPAIAGTMPEQWVHTMLNLPSLDGFQYFTQLTSLGLSGHKQISDLTPLSHLSNLTSLYLSYCEQVSDLTPLSHLSNLTRLDLYGCSQVGDLTPLSHLSNLTRLDLYGCSQVNDLTPLSHLSNLTRLDLAECSQVSDLTPLSHLSNLTRLDLYGCSQVNDLTLLSHLNNLARLDLAECSQISDLTSLSHLNNLTWLNLSYCEQVSDLTPLVGLKQLKVLFLEGLRGKVIISPEFENEVKIIFE